MGLFVPKKLNRLFKTKSVQIGDGKFLNLGTVHSLKHYKNVMMVAWLYAESILLLSERKSCSIKSAYVRTHKFNHRL